MVQAALIGAGFLGRDLRDRHGDCDWNCLPAVFFFSKRVRGGWIELRPVQWKLQGGEVILGDGARAPCN